MKKALHVSIIMLITSYLGFTQSSNIEVRREVDWQARQVRFALSVTVDQRGLPSSRQHAEGWIDRERFRVIARSLQDLVLDSQGSFNDNLPRRVSMRWNLDAAASHARREYASLSGDLKSLEVVYSLSFSDIMRNIEVETYQNVLPIITSNLRAFNYTGVVIFVPAQLPVLGRYNEQGSLEPALAPTLLDENGVTLLSLATIDPAIFESELGGVAYTRELNALRWSPRKIGGNPLILTAVAVAGDQNSTDLVISARDAEQLRTSPQALQLLREARVLIVLQ